VRIRDEYRRVERKGPPRHKHFVYNLSTYTEKLELLYDSLQKFIKLKPKLPPYESRQMLTATLPILDAAICK
jgi:hypothetical protein